MSSNKTSLKILIVGGGCAGPALALWLSRTGHRVTIVERYPVLRASGAQIDLRSHGIEAVKRMGLLELIKSKCVDEEGMSFVDLYGNIIGTIPANKTGKGEQSFTSEYEIMRGDLVRVLYEATKEKVQYIFGKTVDRFEQDQKGVTAYFSDGTSDTFDILVGADGQGSRIRKAILPPNTDPYSRLGLYMGYYFIPRISTDGKFGQGYTAPGGRMIMRRSSTEETQVYLSFRDDSPETAAILNGSSVEKQKEFWTKKFTDAGWETPRFLEGMKSAETFYCHEIVQVKIDKWSDNRVVLLGDAAACPSPMTGMGTSVSFVGAYILAGEINRNLDNLPQAFEEYESKMRPFLNEIFRPRKVFLKLLLPETRLGVHILRYFWKLMFFIGTIIFFLRIPDLFAKFFASENKDGWKLPEYPELRGDSSTNIDQKTFPKDDNNGLAHRKVKPTTQPPNSDETELRT